MNSTEVNSGFIHDSTSLDLQFLVVYKKASRFHIAQQLKYKLTLQMQLQAFKSVLVSTDLFFFPLPLLEDKSRPKKMESFKLEKLTVTKLSSLLSHVLER